MTSKRLYPKRVGFEWFKYFKPKEMKGFDWLQYCGDCIHYHKHTDWCTVIDLRPWKKLDAPVCPIYRYTLFPDFFRPDMFKQYRIVVECKELTL